MRKARLQSSLYAWILLSSLRGLKLANPRRRVYFFDCESGEGVQWGDGITLIDAMPEKGAIGFAFKNTDQALAFFENGKLSLTSMKGIVHIGDWFVFLRGLFSAKGKLGAKGWENLSDEKLVEKSKVAFFSAICGLEGLARLDPFSKSLMEELPQGKLRIGLSGSEPFLTIAVRDGICVWEDQEVTPEDKSVDFLFKDAKSLWITVAGLGDNLAAVGRGTIQLRGYIPLADGFNHMLDRLQIFVKTG